MTELEPVPYEDSHIYALVSAAKHFSVFTPREPSRLESYLHACELLLDQARSASVHGMRWFHENPAFTERHSALERRLDQYIRRTGRQVEIVRKAGIEEELRFLWLQDQLEGIFRCGVLLTYLELPPALEKAFSVLSPPHVVQGGAEALKSASAKARRLAANGQVSLLFRAGEVEIYAPEPSLRRAFNLALKSDKLQY